MTKRATKNKPKTVSKGSQNLSRLHFLLLEDNDFDARMLRQKLRHTFDNCRITTVETLADGVARIESKHYDFIFVDLNLPDSKGIKTIRKVMSVASGRIPVLVYTGKEDAELALASVRLGAQDYLVKGRGDERTIKRIVQYAMERKRFDNAMYERKEILRKFTDHVPAAVAIFDQEMKYLAYSKRWLEDYKLGHQDLIGKHHYDVFPQIKKMPEWKKLHKRALKGEVLRSKEDKFVHEGNTEWLSWELRPWRGADGKIGGIIMFTENVTQRKVMQQALQEANANLERKVAERTRELEVAKLTAEQANAAKTELFTNITHELRTPLHAIINFSTFGIKKADIATREKMQEYFQDIQRSGKRLLGLVNDILDLAKSQANKLHLDIRPNDIRQAIDEATAELSAIIDNNDMQLKVEMKTKDGQAFFDRQRVLQVLVNLLSNAIKFSDAGTTITIRCQPTTKLLRRADDVTGIAVSVSDQGMGIPSKELKTIFDEFSQSEKVKAGKFSVGTGLGLAICREIVHAHNGVIWARNNRGKGATITFTLPVQAKDVPVMTDKL